jgi:hypothetical protein
MNAKSDDDNTGRHPTPLSTSLNGASSHGTQLAGLDGEDTVVEGGVEGVEVVAPDKKDEPVTWRSLPHRRQLIILTLARLSEPLVQTSLQVSSFLLGA